jgi:hypothetical protein
MNSNFEETGGGRTATKKAVHTHYWLSSPKVWVSIA